MVIIDDGSGDEYSHIFEGISDIGATVIRHPVNRGKGRAIKTAIRYCLDELPQYTGGIVTADADGQHKVEDVIKICRELEDNPEKLVLGCRSFNGKDIPLRSRVGNSISQVVYTWLCGIKLNDTQTGLRGIPYTFLCKACEIPGERYEYETNMLLEANNQGIAFDEVKIETVYNDGNLSSHFNPFKDSIMIYLSVLKYSMSAILSTIIDYSIFYLLLKNSINIFLATYLARIIAALVNFVINKNFVFNNKADVPNQLIRYIVLLFGSGTISGLCIELLFRIFGFSKYIAKAIVEVCLFFANFYFQRSFVFRKGN